MLDQEHDNHSDYCPVCANPLSNFGLGEQCASCLLDSIFDDQPSAEEPVQEFGEYLILGELGRGGMGTVYRAEQPRLGRIVALKMLMGGVFAQPSFLERFRREAFAAARLRHEGIAVVHDVGEVDGLAYYTMEILEGGSLQDWIASPLCQVGAAVEILGKIARAVAFAHGHGVLHRDLKPSNILLTSDGKPKVADFGLALLQEESEQEHKRLTLTQGMVGTPSYMAPEVAEGGQASVSSDIYSLGAILYEILTGRPPHDGTNAQAILAQVLVSDVVDPRKHRPDLPIDLARICLKCLDRESPARYQSATSLADDLMRFQAGLPVSARPISAAGQIWRWAKRNRSLAAMILAFLLTITVSTIMVIQQAGINRTQAKALKQEHRATIQSRQELTTHLYAADMRAAAQELEAGNLDGAWQSLKAHQSAPQRGLEWYWMSREVSRRAGQELHQDKGFISALSYSADGQTLVGTNHLGQVFFVKPKTKSWQAAQTHAQWQSRAYLIDDQLWSCTDGQLQSRPLLTNGELGTPTNHAAGRQINFSQNLKWAALCSEPSYFYQIGSGGQASVWDVTSQQVIWTPPATDINHAAISPNGHYLATCHIGGGVTLWDISKREKIHHWDIPPINTIQFSPDSRQLAAGGSNEGWLLAWDQKTPARQLKHVTGHQVTMMAFSPDGTTVASASTDRVIRLWSVQNPDADPIQLLGHDSEVWTLAWHPTGQHLVGGGRDGKVLLWDKHWFGQRDQTLPCSYHRAHFSPSGDSFIMLSGDHPNYQILRYDAENRTSLEVLPTRVNVLGISDDDEAILWDFFSHQLIWWPRRASEPKRTIPFPERPIDTMDQFALSPDGKKIACLDNTGQLEIRSLISNSPPLHIQVLPTSTEQAKWTIRTLRWSPDSNMLAAGVDQAPHHVWLIDSRSQEVTPLPGHRDGITCVDFSSDGRWLATGSAFGQIILWQLDQLSPHPTAVIMAHTRSISDLVFSPDSRTLLSLGGRDGVRFWHTETWRELAYCAIPDAFSHLSISPDGRYITISCGDGLNTPDKLRVIQLK